MEHAIRDHYGTFLARFYSWMGGPRKEQEQKNRAFFQAHDITPRDTRSAIDLGAGCGFQSVPLAKSGYDVLAVDSCGALLEELREHAGDLSIHYAEGDIRDCPVWSGRQPELITCMGDTLTHLGNCGEVRNLIRKCLAELVPGGRLVVSLRDYSREPEGAVVVIPVRRNRDRIFLCRLEYRADMLTVHDILYSRERGTWERTAGTYGKIRIAPDTLARILTDTGFGIDFSSVNGGIICIIARKQLTDIQ